MSAWDTSFSIVVGIEAGLSLDPKDPGNYTPAGKLKGTKYGISAKSFPDEDIANLTVDRAKLLAKGRYWDPIHGDAIAPTLALLMFDSSYNQGADIATKYLQRALGIDDDGDFGPQTLAVANRPRDVGELLVEYTTQRLLGYNRDRDIKTFGHSWFHRTALVLAAAVQLP